MYVPNPADPTQPADTEALATAAAEFRALKQYVITQIAAVKAAVWQTGDIRLIMSATIPAGWLRIPVVATLISRATYPTLTAWIIAQGSPWGVGDGSTTIGMPYIPEGYTIGNTAVAALGARSVGSVIAHTHTYVAPAPGNNAAGGPFGTTVSANVPAGPNTGSTGGAANLPAVTYTAFLIKT